LLITAKLNFSAIQMPSVMLANFVLLSVTVP